MVDAESREVRATPPHSQMVFMHQRVCRESPVKGDKMP